MSQSIQSFYLTLIVDFSSLKPWKSSNVGFRLLVLNRGNCGSDGRKRRSVSFVDRTSLTISTGSRRRLYSVPTATRGDGSSAPESDDNTAMFLQFALWVSEIVYIFWLFLLPYAPGDPIWAISSETINSIIDLSLNFFLILPFLNSAGFHLIEAPVLHPMSEALFNFVIGWTFMFAPLLYTDKNRDKYKGSLAILWSFQMFLTNTFLIPYMAIRLNKDDQFIVSRKKSPLELIMTKGASIVGLVGGFVCVVSILWGIYGRRYGDFGSFYERIEFLVGYIGSERLAYAFIWDICLYTIFQPWLIGDNLQSIQKNRVAVVSILRFIPFVGITAYCLSLSKDNEI